VDKRRKKFMGSSVDEKASDITRPNEGRENDQEKSQ